MSRAMNLRLSEADVVSRCTKLGVSISAIEALPSGGTRVVFTRSDAVEPMREAFRKSVITGAVTRTALRTQAR